MITKTPKITRKSSRKPCKPAKFPRSWYFKANDSRKYPYIDTSLLLSRKFPPMPRDRQQIMVFLCTYLNRGQAIVAYATLGAFYTAKDDIISLSRLSLQKRARGFFKDFFGEDRVFDVGDISKITNLLDALGLIAKRYCAINGEKIANGYILNPVFRDPLFRKQMLGILACTFRGQSKFKFAKRLNKRYSAFGSYTKTIRTIWRYVSVSFMGLTPTHESHQDSGVATKSDNELGRARKGVPLPSDIHPWLRKSLKDVMLNYVQGSIISASHLDYGLY
jgi:hypothetical protein